MEYGPLNTPANGDLSAEAYILPQIFLITELFENIVANLHMRHIFALRLVSRDFRRKIDQSSLLKDICWRRSEKITSDNPDWADPHFGNVEYLKEERKQLVDGKISPDTYTQLEFNAKNWDSLPKCRACGDQHEPIKMENVNPILREGNICWTGYGDQLRIMVPTERRHAMEAFSKTSEMALWRNTYVTQPQCKSIKIFWTPEWQRFKVEEVQDGNGVKVGQLVKKIADLKLYWGKDK